jgi:hypothetical protein
MPFRPFPNEAIFIAVQSTYECLFHPARPDSRRDLLQSIISTNHLFAVTCFYIFQDGSNSPRATPGLIRQWTCAFFCARPQSVCPDCISEILHGGSAHSGSLYHPAQSHTSALQSTSSSVGNSRRTLTRPSIQSDDQSGLIQPVCRQPREEVMKSVEYHLNKNPHLHLKPGIVNAIVNEWSTWDTHFPMTQAISNELKTSTRESSARLLFCIQGKQNDTFHRQVRIVVLCEVILKANDLEPAQRDESRRIKTKDCILVHLQEVGAGMYSSRAKVRGHAHD